ncbi:hypothetical protein LJC57_02450 [Parabacteroides sp. OttesenSCG-928-G07]|nr:hypothetical protein [Parabacteroides sp. OttesenSCG-928-G07]
MSNKIFTRLITFFLILLSNYPAHLYAQADERLFSPSYRLPAEREQGMLSLELENINFFKNNEYAGRVMKGYSLPGFYIQPKASYYALESLKLELGFHALYYHGANKYPAVAYIDIPVWKGEQDQGNTHLLPWLRAHLQLSEKVSIVMGNIYGGVNHNLIEPLYAPELNLTADPEAGVQVLIDTKPFHFDAWMNWQSFIFREDSHQEAFTAGFSSRYNFLPESKSQELYFSLQGLAQHRGGEIDTLTESSVQTIMNGAAGIGFRLKSLNQKVKNLTFAYHLTGYYQQAGDLWPLENGYGHYVMASVDIADFYVKGSYMYSKDFISAYGLPLFGSLSTKEEGAIFDRPQLLTLSLAYTKPLAKGFALGIDANIFHRLATDIRIPETGAWEKAKASTAFDVGIYLRINPSIYIANLRSK